MGEGIRSNNDIDRIKHLAVQICILFNETLKQFMPLYGVLLLLILALVFNACPQSHFFRFLRYQAKVVDEQRVDIRKGKVFI